MVKFAHIADCHLGGWKQPELQAVNFKSFQKAIDESINERVEFVLIAGDLFDTAFPGIEILKDTFAEFRKLKEAKIPCFIIAGSHDFSASGKTFLDVLEKAGFCHNVENVEERDGFLFLNPTIHKGLALYGYPGRKAGLEVQDLRRVKFNDAPGMFKIFMLHTTLDKVKGNLPIDAIEYEKLPKADYYAAGHIHIDFQYENFVYPSPTFPNNFQELEDLGNGGFYIVDTESENPMKRMELKIKKTLNVEIELKNALTATEKIMEILNQKDLNDKIILLRIKGVIETGTQSDIKFQKIEEFVKSKGAYFLLKNTHDLKVKETEFQIEIENTENVEEESIKAYSMENPSDLNKIILPLMNALSIEKQEGETSDAFTNRLMDGTKKIINY